MSENQMVMDDTDPGMRLLLYRATGKLRIQRVTLKINGNAIKLPF